MNKLRKPPSGFTMVPNALIRSSSISLKAKGLYCLLFSKPDNWIYVEEALVNESADGRESYRSGIKELVETGWLTKVQVRDDKGVFSHVDWHLSDDGSAVAGESPTNNTDLIRTEGEIPSVSPKPKTKASSRALAAVRLSQFLENTGGLPPVHWSVYCRDEHGWDPKRANDVWRNFERYWHSPDCPKPLKRDWFGTWQNWCDREAQNGRRGGGTGGTAGGGLAAAINGFVARGERNGKPNGDAAFSTGGGAGADAGDDGRRYDGTEIPF
ncbi:helix-turn-helix domain-containing protein [Rhizobium leguminosarum]|uniref:helix-turn-helix domain-containing protein n=1 Tax=Rhizobium leguminosarum TaxID=384 RepID=UPI0021BBBC01|nr:helix-turn-helix domain-containing protein [Rhizobium leguminosarum]